MVDVNIALIVLTVLVGLVTAVTAVKEARRRRKEILYAIGFAGKNVNGLGIEEQEEVRLELRDKARKHMEKIGLPFDYTEADAKNEERYEARMRELAELREEFIARWDKEKIERSKQQAEVIAISDLRMHHEVASFIEEQNVQQRGVSVLYPKNNPKYTPPKPPKGKKRYRRRDGSTTYQLGLDVSPVYGVKETSDKSIQNAYIEHAAGMEDDYPHNPEELYQKYLVKAQDAIRHQEKEAIKARKLTMDDYRANLKEYEELRKRIMSKAV